MRKERKKVATAKKRSQDAVGGNPRAMMESMRRNLSAFYTKEQVDQIMEWGPQGRFLEIYDRVRTMHTTLKVDIFGRADYLTLGPAVHNALEALHAVMYLVEGELVRAENDGV